MIKSCKEPIGWPLDGMQQCYWSTDKNIWLPKSNITNISPDLIFSPEKYTLKLFRCYSAHPVSILTFYTSLEKVFQAAPKIKIDGSRVEHKKRERYSQALTSKTKLKRAWGILKWRSLNEMMWWRKWLAFGECFKEMACVWRVFYWSRLWEKVFSQGWLIFR